MLKKICPYCESELDSEIKIKETYLSPYLVNLLCVICEREWFCWQCEESMAIEEGMLKLDFDENNIEWE